MGLNVNIGAAKDRLSELIAAAKRGEDVVIARAGRPEVKLVPLDGVMAIEMELAQARRKSAFGMFRDSYNAAAITRAMAPLSDEELADWYGADDATGSVGTPR
jgi:prevent-host-death family protein